MRRIKYTIGILSSAACFVTLVIYSWDQSTLSYQTTTPKIKYNDRPMIHMPLDEIYPEHEENNESDSLELDDKRAPRFILSTIGCHIPLDSNLFHNNDTTPRDRKKITCGKRRVFLKKISSNEVQVTSKQINNCCYRFILGPYTFSSLDNKISYTECKKVQDKSIISLKTDFINILCFGYDPKNKVTHTIYDDVYAFTKKVEENKPKNNNDCEEKYNVLMLGMDSMSLIRFIDKLPRLVKYFSENDWLAYRGYHKVEDNTFPNLMAALTGKNLPTLKKECSNKMDECLKYIIWNDFKKAGYVTAYAEDCVYLPDTFSKNFTFKTPPTDHYLRPLFLKSETKKKSLTCTGKISSGEQLLKYAFEFAHTYEYDNFFGLFWMNSYSHNEISRPEDADVHIENFFNELSYTSIMKSTFIIFFSDHGIRFGKERLKVDSYYDERLPILFIWVPLSFRANHLDKYTKIIKNRLKLLTPYDLYSTLEDIRDISMCKNRSKGNLEACPKCHSLFEEISPNRTCKDIAIHDKWCSCHGLYPLPLDDADGIKTVRFVISHIKNITKTIKTNPCWKCSDKLSLQKVNRLHYHYDAGKTNLIYVVAFTLSPLNVSYEATVLLKNGVRKLIGPVSVISMYNGLERCTVGSRDRWFCYCQRHNNC